MLKEIKMGDVGMFNTTKEFLSVLDGNKNYTCVSIGYINDLISVFNVKEKIYSGTTERGNLYDIHLNCNKMIYGFKESGNLIYIPEGYVSYKLQSDTSLWVEKTLVIKVGAHEANANFTALLAKLGQVVQDELGVAPSSTSMNTSVPVSATTADVIKINAIRGAYKKGKGVTNLSAKYSRNVQALEKAYAKITALEMFIMNCNPGCNPYKGNNKRYTELFDKISKVMCTNEYDINTALNLNESEFRYFAEFIQDTASVLSAIDKNKRNCP